MSNSLSMLLEPNNVSYMNDLLDNKICPLLNKPLHQIDENSVKLNNTVKGKSKLSNKPVTFHTTVKSSGYGNIPSDIIDRKILEKKLIKEKKLKELKNQKKKELIRKQSQESVPNKLGEAYGLLVGSRIRSYPIDCNPMTYHMQNNNYPKNKLFNYPITKICYSSDGKQLAFASSDIAVPAIHLPTNKYNELGHSYIGHNGRIQDIDYSHSNKYLLSTSIDKTIKLWKVGKVDQPIVNFTHVKHQPKVGTYLSTQTTNVSSKNESYPDDIISSRFYYMDQFICMATKNIVNLYDYETDSMFNRSDLNRIQSTGSYQLTHSWLLEGQQVTSLNCINSTKSPIIFAATSDKKLHVLDSITGQVGLEFSSPHQRPIHHIALVQPSIYVSSNAQFIDYNVFSTSSIDNMINLWDLRSTNLIGSYSDHINRRESIKCSISPCMRYLATGSEDNTFHIIDLRTFQQLSRLSFGFRDVVSSVAFHPYLPQLACSSLDGTIKFFCDPAII